MNFPRTIRLDSSDLQVYARTAEPGEWAVPGTFAFVDNDPASFEQKDRLAFHGAWLGTSTFGFASLVEVAEITEDALEAVVERLADHFVNRYGAPDLATARPAAREEVENAASLCDHKAHTLLAIERDWADSGILERVRIIQPSRAEEHAKIWEILPDEEPS